MDTKSISNLKDKLIKNYLPIVKKLFYKYFTLLLAAIIIYSLVISSKVAQIPYYESSNGAAANKVQMVYNPELWLEKFATVVNVDIYSETDYLEKIKTLPQEELDSLGKVLGNKFVNYLVYDFRTGKYLTNASYIKDFVEKVKLHEGEIKEDSLDNEINNYSPIEGFNYKGYSKDSLAVQNFSDHLNYIKNPKDFYEVYWMGLYSMTDLIKSGLATETTYTDWDAINNNSKIIQEIKQQRAAYYIVLGLFIILAAEVGIANLIKKLQKDLGSIKNLFIGRAIIKLITGIKEFFGVMNLAVKFIFFLVMTLIFTYNLYLGYIYSVFHGVFYNIGYFYDLNNLGILISTIIYIVFLLPRAFKFLITVNNIIKGTNRIVKGDLEVTLKEKGEKNLAHLAQNINQIKTGFKVSIDEQIKNERLKSELVTNVSHDLKTPLTSIINYIDIIQREDITEEERKDYINILSVKSNKLKYLIEDLFEVSKMNSGKVELEKEEVDIVELLQQSIGECSNIYSEKNINFKLNTFEDKIIMNLDGKKISRVFENLITNALKYSMENTRVYIQVIEKEKGIEISFKNIAAYEIDFETAELFERFKRGDESRTSSVEGSGLGLAIAKSIVGLHGGTMDIEVEGDLFKVFINL